MLSIPLCVFSKPQSMCSRKRCVVEHRGFEPLTSTLPVLRAPNCANAPLPAYCTIPYGACQSINENLPDRRKGAHMVVSEPRKQIAILSAVHDCADILCVLLGNIDVRDLFNTAEEGVGIDLADQVAVFTE